MEDNKLSKEQKKVVADLYSPDIDVIMQTLERIRDIGGEYCVAPMIEIFFSTPFAEVRSEIGNVFMDVRSKKMANAVIEGLKPYTDHEYFRDFTSILWQSSIAFEDLSLFVEKFVTADEIYAFECLSLVENNTGNISLESAKKCIQLLKTNQFTGSKQKLAEELIGMLEDIA
ncbi:MAG: hypothetical protein HUK15_05035 [Bacteroidales bacterium]|nr:hypothetical protein [Bacteroidales bacterium]